MFPILGADLQLKRLPRATLAIICINAVVFAAESLLPQQVLESAFNIFGYGPANWWNPLAAVTHMFLHGDIYHIFFNMLFLWIFGGPVEDRVGTGRFALYYLAAGVFAGVFQTVMEVVARPDSLTGGIGASGAITGVMALFLYRCYFADVRMMVITGRHMPFEINIPAAPLVAFWFFQDFFYGILSMSTPSNIGHWAHVGGFVCGIAIGRLTGLGQEGRVEQLRERVMKKLGSGTGWGSVEKELVELGGLLPSDHEVAHELARMYASGGKTGDSERLYRSAATLSLSSDPLAGAYIVIEGSDAIGGQLPTRYHLKAAEVLTAAGEYGDARRVLKFIAAAGGAKGRLEEKALVLYIKLCVHIGDMEDAFDAASLFHNEYPKSLSGRDVQGSLRMKPGEVFERPKGVPPSRDGNAESAAESREAGALGWIEFVQQFFSDPVLWLMMPFLSIYSMAFASDTSLGRFTPVFMFFTAIVLTVVHRMGSDLDYLIYFRKPDNRANREFELKRDLKEAMMAERGGNYDLAVEMYEKILSIDDADPVARLNLARICHKKLGDEKAARRHYRMLITRLPQGHAVRAEAEYAIKEIYAGQP